MTTTTPGDAARPPPWLAWPIGARVVVRRRLPEGGYADVLGEVLASDDDGVHVASRRGPVHIAAADYALGKLVPPPPARQPRRPPPD